MINKGKKSQDQIHLSFSQPNQQKTIDENRLQVQMLRVNTTQKQRIMMQIWSMDREELSKYFTSYKLFPTQLFTLKHLLQSTNLKLMKTNDKIYFGQVKQKQRSGKGIYITKQGKLYEGEFKNNNRNGQGIEIYENGNLYIGEFLNNKKHGKGKFYWFSLIKKSKVYEIQQYEGEWWGGLPDGSGIHQKSNGTILIYEGDNYFGSFKNGLKHGLGQEYFGNGDYYKGQYVNGLPEGFGEYLWEEGSIYKGDFKHGVRCGYGYWFMDKKQSNEKYEGHYQMDKKSGYGVYKWENGWYYKGNFENDYRHGFGQLFTANNEIVYRGNWENGQETTGQAFDHSNLQTNQNITQESEQIEKEMSPKKQFSNYLRDIIKFKPSFSVRKRPQSFSHLRNQEGASSTRYTPMKDKSTIGQTSRTSTSKTLNKFTFYVPWQYSRR